MLRAFGDIAGVRSHRHFTAYSQSCREFTPSYTHIAISFEPDAIATVHWQVDLLRSTDFEYACCDLWKRTITQADFL
jgi:hypothetical protein